MNFQLGSRSLGNGTRKNGNSDTPMSHCTRAAPDGAQSKLSDSNKTIPIL